MTNVVQEWFVEIKHIYVNDSEVADLIAADAVNSLGPSFCRWLFGCTSYFPVSQGSFLLTWYAIDNQEMGFKV
ncbi:unnamed protein product [Linum trigynum]|uniref:Uncharacterized protein n=1 Tax=Linum trigynum TaxID=586398 RepID=A0AAV2EU44_9ROSI